MASLKQDDLTGETGEAAEFMKMSFTRFYGKGTFVKADLDIKATTFKKVVGTETKIRWIQMTKDPSTGKWIEGEASPGIIEEAFAEQKRLSQR